MKAKKQKQGYNAELQPNMIYYTGTLKQFYFARLAPHTHVYTEPKRNGSRDFPVVESLPRDRNSELLRRGPRARASRRHVWPFDITNGVSGAISARIRGRGNC